MSEFSELWKMDSQEFLRIVNNSKTMNQIKDYINNNVAVVSLVTIRKRIKKENVDITHIRNFKRERTSYTNKITIPLEQILVENSTYSQQRLKKRLVQENLLTYACKECGNTGKWQEKFLSLHLDHINGKHTDNRIENLRFLCPNCHSQTETYAGKALKKHYYCKDCGKKIRNRSIFCKECFNKRDRINARRFEISKEELEKLLEEMPMTKIGEKFGVSANAIKRRAEKLGIILKNRLGFWQKNNTKLCDCGNTMHFSSKKCKECLEKDKGTCTICGKKLSDSVTGVCNVCYVRPTKTNWPSKEELEKMIWEMPMTILAKQLKISDKAICKRCKKLGIPKPPIGYWLKQKEIAPVGNAPTTKTL